MIPNGSAKMTRPRQCRAIEFPGMSDPMNRRASQQGMGREDAHLAGNSMHLKPIKDGEQVGAVNLRP